ncbi:diguanylate cyclase [Alteromonas pelagimontana]|uniref:diguanylate cyclase n=1 Tax=Alteromonas pelagimontana TaxID=1858656 RepID=A0A6M4MIB6_9ALTE|nr:diguanylate cyclase [Alteromonas pelagimontana]QJR82375.1 diguanylate cyclase [Alteromonas pelagimontana]
MPQTRPRVLIVDDDTTTIHIIAAALSSDYEVTIATTAGEGFRLATTVKPHIILVDVVMPQVSGFEFCKQLKQDERTHKIPVIFVSAEDTIRQQTKGFDIGGVDYIIKPVEVPILKARVKTHTRLYRQTLQLESLAATDPLTNLANRRKFDEAIEHEIERCQRNGNPLALLIVDIDDFKSYNDYYGHAKGDDCLVAVARILKAEAKRSTDLVSRLGGEEFGIILGETDDSGAMAIAEAIIAEFRHQQIEHVKANQAAYLSVSIGVTFVDFSRGGRQGVSIRTLVDTADHALYRAKDAGRNRIEYEYLEVPGKPH